MTMKEKKKAASTTANLQHRSGNKDSKSSNQTTDSQTILRWWQVH